MTYIDAHLHMDWSKHSFAALKAARKAGVKYLLSNGTDPAANWRNVLLASNSKNILAAQGFFPDYVERFSKSEISAELKRIVKDKNKIVAIGEIGLDRREGKPIPKMQIWMLRELLKVAEKIKKPVIIHSRGSSKEVMDELKKFKGTVILHYWLGSKKLTDEAAARGYYFTVNPVIFRDPTVERIVHDVPLDRLLTETDFPYSIFNPDQIPEIVKKIADIRSMKSAEVEQQIFNTFKSLFL